MQNTLKDVLCDNSITYPESVQSYADLISARLKRISGTLNIKNKEKVKTVKLNKERFLSSEFKELWNKIKYKTTYRIDFDSDKLIEECVKQISDEQQLIVTYPKYIFGKGKVNVTPSGVSITDENNHTEPFTFDVFDIPDVISYLQNETNLTRKTLVKILLDSNRLNDFRKNPQMFIDGTITIIKNVMSKFVVDGIKYHQLGNDDIWAQELFQNEELTGYLGQNMVETPNHGIYECTLYDSDVEREFAKRLDANDDVKVFAKLPDWFKIPTPLGTYNPDWAIFVEKDGQNRLYFVVETKGTNLLGDLPAQQQSKIKCGKAHFAALGDNSVKFVAPVATYDEFDNHVQNEIMNM